MTLSLVSMMFDAVLACLLAVMIFYAVRLNRHILTLRERESEMQDMIMQFNHSSAAAHASASALKSAGTEAEVGVKAAIAKAMLLRNDLQMMLDRADALCGKLDAHETYQARTETRMPSRPAPVPATPQPAERDPLPAARVANMRPFAPPPGARDRVVNTTMPEKRDALEPRSEAERQLLAAIRAAKEGVA